MTTDGQVSVASVPYGASTLDIALAASGCDQAHVQHRPRLLSDNGPSYIAQDLACSPSAPMAQIQG
jgi:hypothetical protein